MNILQKVTQNKYNIWLFRRFCTCKFLQRILSKEILRIMGTKLHQSAKNGHAVPCAQLSPNRLAVPLRFALLVHHPPDADDCGVVGGRKLEMKR